MQQADKKELPEQGNPENGQSPIQYSEEDIKNLQAFGTKAQQEKIDFAVKLAQKDPTEIKSMEKELQNKVIKKVYGYDNVEELEIMLPSVFQKSDKNDEGDDEEDIKKQVKMLQYQLGKEALNKELEKQISAKKEFEAIPSFRSKVEEELKFISQDIPTEDRIKRAIKIVSADNNIIAESFLNLQGKSIGKSPNENKPSTDEELEQERNRLRKALGLKPKK